MLGEKFAGKILAEWMEKIDTMSAEFLKPLHEIIAQLKEVVTILKRIEAMQGENRGPENDSHS